MSRTLSLIPDEQDDIRFYLKAVFEAWVEQRRKNTGGGRGSGPLREESVEVYADMWNTFIDFCAARLLNLETVTIEDLKLFLATRGTGPADTAARAHAKEIELSDRYAWRLLALIDRLTQFDALRTQSIPNPAAERLLQTENLRYANADQRDPLPDYLALADAKRLIDYITQKTPAPGTEQLSWKDVRDRTAVALMLGGGLTPGDVRATTLTGVIVEGGRKAGIPWKLAVPGNGNMAARETPLATWAGQQLAYWLEVRAEQRIPGEHLFPSTRTGNAWQHSSCYVACTAILEQAGLTSTEGGMMKLRHTFALRQIAKGKSKRDVAQWLGYKDDSMMQRYERIVPYQVDVA